MLSSNLKKILIDSNQSETRVALVKDGLLIGYDVEDSVNLPQKGNIYLGVVSRVDDSLQAAFVEYLPGEYGFLPFSEVPVCYFDVLEEVKQSAVSDDKHMHLYKSFNISEVLKKDLKIHVQVTKEKRRSKDVTLTAYVRLPNRYCVLMPFSKDIVLSKQITDEKVVESLTALAEEVTKNKNYGVIFKSHCDGADRKRIIDDYNFLLKEWVVILTNTPSTPQLVYSEANLLKKTIRDLYDSSVGAVVVNSEVAYKEAIQYVQSSISGDSSQISLYQDALPLFFRYKVENQIESLYEDSVPLRSGGYLVINTTEALTAIDVNSGRMRREKNIEETAYKVNMEAAVEIVRQLELRGIAGIIVIDLIDMNNSKYVANVERAILDAFKRYKSRVQVSSIGKFGLLTISKQRTKNNISDSVHNHCSACEGRGKILKSPLRLRMLLSAVYSVQSCSEVIIKTSAELALLILNEARDAITKAEQDLNCKIKVEVGDISILPKGFEVIVQKSEVTGLPAVIPTSGKNNQLMKIENQPVDSKVSKVKGDSESKKKGFSWVAGWIRKIIGCSGC